MYIHCIYIQLFNYLLINIFLEYNDTIIIIIV